MILSSCPFISQKNVPSENPKSTYGRKWLQREEKLRACPTTRLHKRKALLPRETRHQLLDLLSYKSNGSSFTVESTEKALQKFRVKTVGFSLEYDELLS